MGMAGLVPNIGMPDYPPIPTHDAPVRPGAVV